MTRIANFIDAGYFDHLLRDVHRGLRVDYARLVAEMSRGHEVLRTSYYDCLPPQDDVSNGRQNVCTSNKGAFLKALSFLPRFEIRLGKLERRGRDDRGNPVYRQKRVDVQLAVDLARMATMRAITDAAVLAGDSDFIPAIEAAKAEGVVVHLFYTDGAHRDLIAACDERIRISSEFLRSIAWERSS